MKKIIYLSLLFIAVGLVGCKSGSVSSDSIVGKWQVTDADIQLKNMPEGAEAMVEMMKKAILETKYEFKKDGTYGIESVFPGSGKWEYDAAKNAITLSADNSEKEPNVLQILSGSADKMKVKNDKKEEGYIDLTLEKVKETTEQE